MDKFTRVRNLVFAISAAALLAAWAMGDDLPWIYDVSGRSVAAPTTSETTVSADLDYRFKIEASSAEIPFTTRPTKATVLMVR
jgi:hypothetical protein